MKCFMAIMGLFLFYSCGENYFFNEDKAIEGRNWDYRNKMEYEVNFEDIASSYDFFVDFRHNDSYPYSEIYLFMDIVMPDGKTVNDTIKYVMQSPEGRWLGSNSGSIIENHVLVKPNVKMPAKGKYKFRLTHGMRDTVLTGMEDIGLVIAKRNK